MNPASKPSAKSGRTQLPWRNKDDPETRELKKMLVSQITIYKPHICLDAKEREVKWNQVTRAFFLDTRTRQFNQVPQKLIKLLSANVCYH
jgi:putative NIF3 family GTP cyclohydrolase 1 type 2